MTSDDKVEVAFLYRGRQVETRYCPRSQADKLGRQLVTIYAGMMDGHYEVREMPTLGHRPKPKVRVSHYFVEVA